MAEGGDPVFERFTDRARRVLVLAQEEARLLNHNYIGTEHILLGLLNEGDSVAARALVSLVVTLEAVRHEVAEAVGPQTSAPAGSPPFTPRAKKVLELSLRESLELDHKLIGPGDVLLGLVREGEGVAANVLISLGADLPRVRQEVIQLMSGAPPAGAAEAEAPGAGISIEVAGRSVQDYADALNWLATVLAERGLDFAEVDPSCIRFRGEMTPSGPGLRVTCWPV